MNFKEYLLNEQLADKSILEHQKNVGYYINWAKQEDVKFEQATYNEVLLYVKVLQNQLKPRTVKNRINSLKKYFSYLELQEIRNDHPIQHLHIKNIKRKIIHQILEQEELDQLYDNYKETKKGTPNYQQNLFLVGLLIYQGIDTSTLQQLEANHIQIEEGTIYLPSTTRSNSRTLPLLSKQIIATHIYLETQATQELANKLFSNIHNQLQAILVQLKQLNHNLQHIRQIRTSVITHWLKQYNLREVQYFAGHRYISSTESYCRADLESLQQELKKYHPFA